MASVTCARCGSETPPEVEGPAGAASQGWTRFEGLKDAGDTIYFITVCPDCLTEAEEASVWTELLREAS
jgi:hypothetical protein